MFTLKSNNYMTFDAYKDKEIINDLMDYLRKLGCTKVYWELSYSWVTVNWTNELKRNKEIREKAINFVESYFKYYKNGKVS